MGALSVLASLRLTVVLFAFSICLIFVGTLAQKDHDVWYVLHNYFRTWVAAVEFRTFERLVQIFNPAVEWNLKGSFPFPGGNVIGSLLLVNLFAAHAVRFKIEARGRRLAIGVGVLALGILGVALAIASGMNNAVESELSPAFLSFLWQAFRGLLVVVALAGANGLRLARGRIRTVEWSVLLVLELALAGLAILLLVNPSLRLDNSGLRLLWQFIKGGGAGLVLLAGSILVFRKRAGIVLLHSGIALIMLGEVWTAFQSKETQVSIPEGGTANYSTDFRQLELTIVDRSAADSDRVTVVPTSLLAANVGKSKPIDHAELPFAIQVHLWLPNAKLMSADGSQPNPATAGIGRNGVAVLAPPATGIGDDKTDFPAAYVNLVHKQTGQSLGTYLMAAELPMEQPVEVDGRSYDVALRFERIYWPFTLTLKNFEFGRYTGTNEPKDFSSLVQLREPARNVDQELKIWMNNPLRVLGFTIYQADFDHDTEKASILTVVANPSWMTPYVGCMIVATGLLAHFGAMLFRFVRRRADERQFVPLTEVAPPARKGAQPMQRAHSQVGKTGWTKWLPAMIVAFFALYLVSKTRMPTAAPSEMQVYEFGRLPLSYEGRIKPYDTLARHALQFLSGRQELIVTDKNGEDVRRPAIIWLLDAISGIEAADDHRIFRIEHAKLLQTLGLEPRPGSYRYSLREITSKMATVEKPAAQPADGEKNPRNENEVEQIPELQRQIALAGAVPEAERTPDQNKVLQLATKKNLYDAITYSFRSPPLSARTEDFVESVATTQRLIAMLREAHAPHAVPPADASTRWTPLLEAEFEGLRARVEDRPVNPATVALGNLLASYGRGDATTFNQSLAEYRRVLSGYEAILETNAAQLKNSGAKAAEIYSSAKGRFEVFFNQFSPFYYCVVLYLAAFVLGALSWLGGTEPLRRSSMWLLWFTFVVHTLALVGRIYISGRPPVTNLYSAAIFIGWGAVALALIIESIYRLGLGNIVAAVCGFLTLLVAHFLSLDGDTFIVMKAVLDTQFWLATHVVCIVLGYATTYAAGAFGILYVFLAHVFPVLKETERRELTRMTYGTLCFAILFSFVGTVLGGLWGDDSWGRFWGWDPKENGALMIVLYNAIGLHARWGGLVKARGLALLTVGGNIVVTWSYFGVNELGAGLHAYGASEKSTAMWLLAFAASQLAIIALGAMPRRWFGPLASSRLQSTT